MRIILVCAAGLFLSTLSLAEESSPAASSSASAATAAPAVLPVPAASAPASVARSGRPSLFYLRTSVLGSRSGQKKDLRTFATSGRDESGSLSESTVLPNLNYLTLFGTVMLSRTQSLMFLGMQPLDSKEDRTVELPYGAKFVLPGQIAMARYIYRLNNEWSLSAGSVYVDTFKMTDPTATISNRRRWDNGLGTRGSLTLAAPLTSRSKDDGLVTRATARAGLSGSVEDWSWSMGLAYSQAFYESRSQLTNLVNAREAARRPQPSARPSGGTGRPGGPPGASPRAAGGPPPTTRPELIDTILADKEMNRATVGMGGGYQISRKWKLSSALGASHVRTLRNGGAYWLTNFRAMNATFTHKQWEAGAEFGLNSDVTKYRSPSLPKQWNAGLRLAYSFGELPFGPM